MPVTQILGFADLVTYLEESKVPHRKDAASQVIELPITAPVHGVVYVRWDKRLPYVQVLLPFVTGVPDDRLHEVETAIVRANAINPVPGLGFEHAHKFVYMRLCVPVYEEGIRALSFQKQVIAVLQLAADFAAPFRDIVAGAPGASVMELAVKHAAERAAAKP
jgi:hypothetical protein